MTGQQLYKKYQDEAEKAGRRSDAARYARELETALIVVGRDELYTALEQAEVASQRIELTYPIDPKIGPSEPDGIQLVAMIS